MYGAGGQKRVPEAFVKDFAVGLPSAFSEQALIATFLDHETAKIDDLIAEQQRLIELLQEKRQAVISHAVTKGLNPDAPIKDSGVEWLGEVPEHWEVCPVKFLARIGNGSTPNRDNSDYWTDVGFPWLNSSVVNQAEVSEAERFVTQLALKECHLPIIEPPAVLVGITGQGKTRGMAAPLRFVATVNQHVAYIKPDVERLGIDYLQRALEAAYEHLRTESEGVGSTKGAITCEQLGAWKLPIPHLREQEAIVSYLNEEAARLDSLKGESDRAIGLLQERRSALISAAVTGRIDVRGLVPAEAAA
nr:restriction endonuclease subunit S [Synechococcus sp. FACHB-909]